MKKLIGTMAVALLAAAAVFADIGVGAWCAAIFSPVVVNDEDITTGIRAPWGGNGRVVGLSFNGVAGDGKAGISSDLRWEGGTGVGGGDTAVMWVKPIEMLRVSFGVWDYTAFNSGVTLPSWDYLRPNNMIADDDKLAFAQIGSQWGCQLELKPIDGLTIMWNLPVTNDAQAYEMFEGQQIGAMYNISSIGTIKAGWVGQMGGTNGKTAAGKKYLGDILAAFELTAVENLFATVGFKFSIAEDDWKDSAKKLNNNYLWPADAFEMIKIGLAARYQINDAFAVMGNFGVSIFDDTNKSDPVMAFGIGASYNVTDAVQVAGDVRALLPNNDLDPVISFFIGVNYTCSSNGSVGIGFQGMMDSNKADQKVGAPVWLNNRAWESTDKNTLAKDFSLAIPIRMTLAF